MKYIQITLLVSDEMHLKSIQFDENETELPNDSNTLKLLAEAMLRGLNKDKECIAIQDVLNELNIPRSE